MRGGRLRRRVRRGPAPYLAISLQLTILAENRAYLQLAGRSSADLLGRGLFDAFPDNPADPHDGDGGRKALMIALTAYGQAQDRLLSTEAGFDHHFVKPVDIDALTALLHHAQIRNIH